MSFSEDWVFYNEANWREHFKGLVGHPVRMLEVGSFEGRSTCWFLANVLTHPLAVIDCVDTFTEPWYTARPGADVEPRFWENVDATGSRQKVRTRRGKSADVLPSLRAESNGYHAIYLDASHDVDDVLEDLVLVFPLLRPGGILLCDDYDLRNHKDPTLYPQPAFDAFAKCFARRIASVSLHPAPYPGRPTQMKIVKR